MATPNLYKKTFENMQAMLAANPAASRAKFQVSTKQVDGLRSEATIRQFHLTVDEPPALAGTDHGPNPVELILAALGTCQEITYRLYAEKMGIVLRSISVELTGDLDLRGFFAVSEQSRPGFLEVSATVKIDSPASDEELAALREIVDRHCPVADILANRTPVSLTMTRTSNAPAARAEEAPATLSMSA